MTFCLNVQTRQAPYSWTQSCSKRLASQAQERRQRSCIILKAENQFQVSSIVTNLLPTYGLTIFLLFTVQSCLIGSSG